MKIKTNVDTRLNSSYVRLVSLFTMETTQGILAMKKIRKKFSIQKININIAVS